MSYELKLNSLKERRSMPLNVRNSYGMDHTAGLESLVSLNESSGLEFFYGIEESAEIKYAIGAMQAVSQRYTEICFEEGRRVAKSLIDDLKKIGLNATLDFQGSVPLDIHIKGVSDVDVLIFHPYLTYEPPAASHMNYTPISSGGTILEAIRELRANSESILENNYPQATVDITGAKAINMEGGSLRRKVDIVPAHWHDSIEYQNNKIISNREVKIYDKGNHNTLGNWPFKHMHAINSRDVDYNGNLKKVCRLLKNIKSDAPRSSQAALKYLSSYDIAGLAFHMGQGLSCPEFYDLGLVANTSEFLTSIESNNFERGRLLITPDNSRIILENENKIIAARILIQEVRQLFMDIIESINPFIDEHTGKQLIKEKALYN